MPSDLTEATNPMDVIAGMYLGGVCPARAASNGVSKVKVKADYENMKTSVCAHPIFFDPTLY